jgi:hypothetical protein
MQMLGTASYRYRRIAGESTPNSRPESMQRRCAAAGAGSRSAVEIVPQADRAASTTRNAAAAIVF